ncbi:MAG: hypothetical protein AAF430_14425 [Myxococcota bacterium]
MRLLWLGSILALTLACGSDIADFEALAPDQDSPLEQALRSNTAWPYETVGTLDIVEVVFGDESELPTDAFGSLLTEGDDEWGVPVDLGAEVIRSSGVDIDSGEKVRVWLGAPHDPHGAGESYPVARLERL